MTDLDGTYQTSEAEPTQAPAPAAQADTPAAAQPSSSGSSVVSIDAALLERLLAVVEGRAPASPALAEVALPRVAPADALKVGAFVTHRGRLCVITEVLTTERTTPKGETWTQVSYRVGVFAENRVYEAEAVRGA